GERLGRRHVVDRRGIYIRRRLDRYNARRGCDRSVRVSDFKANRLWTWRGIRMRRDLVRRPLGVPEPVGLPVPAYFQRRRSVMAVEGTTRIAAKGRKSAARSR